MCGAAPPEVLVSGRVVDENNAAVALATVRVRPVPEFRGLEISVSAGPGGNFALRLPGPGKYAVSATRPGFFPLKDQPFEITGSSQTLHLVLNHLEELFSSVEVQGDSEEIDPQAVQAERAVTNLEILNIPYQGRDAANALKLLPGVVQDPLGGLHLSGGAANQVLYTLDDFNITDPLRGTFKSRLNIDAVRSIDYSAGRQSAQFGKGSAGTVAIATQVGTDALQYNATNFVPGIDFTSGIHVGTWSPRFQLSGPVVRGRMWFTESIGAAYSQSVMEDVKGPNRTTTLNLDNLLRTQVNLTPARQVTASFLVNSSNTPRSGLTALDPWSTTVDRRSRTWFFSVKQTNYLRGGAVLEWGYAENRTFGRQIPQGSGLLVLTPFGKRGNYFLDSTERAARRQLILNVSPRAIRLGGTHQLKFGLDADRLTYDAWNSRSGYELRGLDGRQVNRVTFEGSGAFSRPNAEVSWYAADSWRLKPNLTIEAGVRQDWDELLRRPSLSPRVAGAWSPFRWKNTKFTGGYAITRDPTSLDVFSRPLDQRSVTLTFGPDGAISAPAVTYFTIRGGNLKMPKYRNWTAGLEQRLPRRIVLTVEFTRKRGQNGLTYLAIPNPADPAIHAIFDLKNYRRDVFDSAEITVRQPFGKRYQWMASYTRSRALSNSVVSLSVDQPLWVTNNVGRMPWDAPNHLLAWGHFPLPLRDWSLSWLTEAREGFPFSVVTDWGATVGEINSHRYPMYFTLDLHLERRLKLANRAVALRGGFSNITKHPNPTVVNNTIGAPGFLTYYGSPGRHLIFRLRWLGTGG